MNPTEVSQILNSAATGQVANAEALAPLLFEELNEVAARQLRRESPGHTLEPGALVNEAYLKLADQKDVDWRGKSHFLAVSARVMRRILVDHARGKHRQKRGGERRRIELRDDMQIGGRAEADIAALDEALEKLRRADQLLAQIVEMRFFAGMTVAEVAAALGMSKRSVEAQWTLVKSWLKRELAEFDSRSEEAS